MPNLQSKGLPRGRQEKSPRSRLLPVPTLQSPAHLGFRIDPESVCQAIDVIEVSDHLDRVQDVAVGQAVLAQRLDVLLAQGRRRARDALREFAQRLLPRGEPGASVIVLDVFGKLGVA